MTTTMKTLAQFITETGIRMTVERIPFRPDGNDSDWDAKARHFRCTLKTLRKRMTLTFSQGSAHTEDPTAADVLSCLADDTASVENAEDFESWADEFGYDTDSRKAEKTYKACASQARQLKTLLGNKSYQALLWETERL